MGLLPQFEKHFSSIEFLPKPPWKSPVCNTRSNFTLWCDLKASIMLTLASVQELKQETLQMQTSSFQSVPASSTVNLLGTEGHETPA